VGAVGPPPDSHPPAAGRTSVPAAHPPVAERSRHRQAVT
jgi:hypothetical protein